MPPYYHISPQSSVFKSWLRVASIKYLSSGTRQTTRSGTRVTNYHLPGYGSPNLCVLVSIYIFDALGFGKVYRSFLVVIISHL